MKKLKTWPIIIPLMCSTKFNVEIWIVACMMIIIMIIIVSKFQPNLPISFEL